MTRSLIRTVPPRPPLMADYERATQDFSWRQARDWLAGLPGGRGLNIAHEAVDRHAHGPGADRVALRYLDRHRGPVDYSYAELSRLTNRFAAVLRRLGVRRGDTVCTLLGRSPELYVAALGTLKNTSVLCPLSPAFGPEPVRERLKLARARVLVTTPQLYRRVVADARDAPADLEHVLLVGGAGGTAGDEEAGGRAIVPGALWLDAQLAEAPDESEIPATSTQDPALLHFTSGTAGRPKGAMHVHEAVVAHHATAMLALDLRPDDVFWCTADPGRSTGTSYGIIAPLTRGATVVVDPGDFDPRRWYQVLSEQRVTVWYTAPTAIRMLMRRGVELPKAVDLSSLRHVASGGAPLGAEAVLWGEEAFDLPIHDTWWQTETGAIMIGNFPGEEIRPGSMGRPVPGIEATVLARGPDGRARVTGGRVSELTEPGEVGELALRAGWPSMFRGYLDRPQRYARCIADGWYLTGDLARRDEDGWFWFARRADGVTESSGEPGQPAGDLSTAEGA